MKLGANAVGKSQFRWKNADLFLPQAMEKTLFGWVMMGNLLPSYMGIIINHYKDSRRVFFVAHLFIHCDEV